MPPSPPPPSPTSNSPDASPNPVTPSAPCTPAPGLTTDAPKVGEIYFWVELREGPFQVISWLESAGEGPWELWWAGSWVSDSLADHANIILCSCMRLSVLSWVGGDGAAAVGKRLWGCEVSGSWWLLFGLVGGVCRFYKSPPSPSSPPLPILASTPILPSPRCPATTSLPSPKSKTS